MPVTLTRVVSACAVALAANFPEPIFLSLCVSVAFTHYCMAVIYSPRALRQFWYSTGALFRFFSLSATIALALFGSPYWMFLGVAHYLLGDVLIFKKEYVGRIVFNLVACFLVFRSTWIPLVTPTWGLGLMMGLLTLGIFVYAFNLIAADRDVAGFESVSGLITLLSLSVPLRFEHASLLHFLFWGFLPVMGPRRLPRTARIRYLALSLAIGGFVFCLTPAGVFPLPWPIVLKSWAVASNFHIGLSLFMNAGMATLISPFRFWVTEAKMMPRPK